MLIVEAYYTCKPGMRDKLLEIVKPNIDGTRREPGNISYAHYPSPDNDVDMFVFEKWESLELFNNHSKTEHHKTFCAARRPLLEAGSYFITIYNAEVTEERTQQSREFVRRAIN